MKRAFRVVLGQRLNDPDREPVLRLFEIKNNFALTAAVFLFPLKHFFYVWVFDDRNALVEIEKPLNNIGNGIEVNVSTSIVQQWRIQRNLMAHAFAITVSGS